MVPMLVTQPTAGDSTQRLGPASDENSKANTPLRRAGGALLGRYVCRWPSNAAAASDVSFKDVLNARVQLKSGVAKPQAANGAQSSACGSLTC